MGGGRAGGGSKEKSAFLRTEQAEPLVSWNTILTVGFDSVHLGSGMVYVKRARQVARAILAVCVPGMCRVRRVSAKRRARNPKPNTEHQHLNQKQYQVRKKQNQRQNKARGDNENQNQIRNQQQKNKARTNFRNRNHK